jgi:outer membrane biosynthesis protein TonB
MDRKRTIVVGVLLASSLMLSGCKKKKPPLPPQAQAPTITDSIGVPSAIPEVTVPQPSPKPHPTKPSPTVAKPKKKPRVTTKSEAKKTPPPATQLPAPQPPAEKVVIEEGAKQDPVPPPLVADTSLDQVAHQRLSTAQLISSTEYDIRTISRSLSSDEQAIVQHIRGFIEQSRQATKDGDTERAYNLAVKAHLLSDSLAKK